MTEIHKDLSVDSHCHSTDKTHGFILRVQNLSVKARSSYHFDVARELTSLASV